MKTCKRCNIAKPLDGFYVNKRMKDGHLSFCKDCIKKQVYKYIKANKDDVRRRNRAYKQRQRESNKQWREKELKKNEQKINMLKSENLQTMNKLAKAKEQLKKMEDDIKNAIFSLEYAKTLVDSKTYIGGKLKQEIDNTIKELKQ